MRQETGILFSFALLQMPPRLKKRTQKKISEALNHGSDEPNIFVEDKNFAVAVNFSPRSGDKTCIIAYGLDAQNDAQIFKIKDAAKKEQENFDKLANITPQEFLAAYNDTLTTQGKYDNTDYSKFKTTAVINNPDMNSGTNGILQLR